MRYVLIDFLLYKLSSNPQQLIHEETDSSLYNFFFVLY